MIKEKFENYVFLFFKPTISNTTSLSTYPNDKINNVNTTNEVKIPGINDKCNKYSNKNVPKTDSASRSIFLSKDFRCVRSLIRTIVTSV